MEHIYKLLRSFKWDCAKYLYKNTLNFKVKRLRRKKNIRVLFAVAESATWKSDCLYKAMAEHPRFTPSIHVLIYFVEKGMLVLILIKMEN